MQSSHKRSILETPLQVDPLQAVETKFDRVGVQRLLGCRVEKPDRGRLQTIVGLRQRSPERVLEYAGSLAVEHGRDFLEVIPRCQDQISVLDRPDP
jgi:hypothetical protein